MKQEGGSKEEKEEEWKDHSLFKYILSSYRLNHVTKVFLFLCRIDHRGRGRVEGGGQ